MDAHYGLAEDQASSNNNNANQFLVRDKFAKAKVLKRIIKSHDERIKILQKDDKELMEERDELLEDKANLIHDLLEVKDQNKKLEIDVNHLESETSEMWAMNVANIISDREKNEKFRKIETIIRRVTIVLALLLSLSLYPRREIQRRSFRVCKFSGSNQLTKKNQKRSHEPLRRHEEPCPGRRRCRHRREEPALLPQAAPPGRAPPVPPEQPLRRRGRHGSARPAPIKGRRKQSLGSFPAAAAVLRLTAAAGLEPGGSRQPVRHGLPVQPPAVVAGDVVTGHTVAGGGSSNPAPGGATDVAALCGRVRSRVPASRSRRGF